MSADIYILIVARNRRETLLDTLDRRRGAAEAVPDFSRTAGATSMVVLASFETGYITHVADGRKGVRAATELVRLNLDDLEKLNCRVKFSDILKKVKNKCKRHVKIRFEAGGVLPPASRSDVATIVSNMNPEIEYRLQKLLPRRTEFLRSLNGREIENLALQKDTLNTAFNIADISKNSNLWWQVPGGGSGISSYLDGMPKKVIREDAMIVNDLHQLPDFLPEDFASSEKRTFIDSRRPNVQLTVTMANRAKLEEQTGADLIYHNDTHKNFILVQYKAMTERDGDPEFRWSEGGNFLKQIALMYKFHKELKNIPSGKSGKNYRFTDNPFFLKFCKKTVFNPDEAKMITGMYLPLDYWKIADRTGQFRGKHDGKVINYENVGRYMNNTEFAKLVSGSWVGTTVDQSFCLAKMIREILETGKTVTFADFRIRNGLSFGSVYEQAKRGEIQ